MTPIASASAHRLATPALAAEYAEAVARVGAYNAKLKELRGVEKSLAKLDRSVAFWERLAFLGFAKRRSQSQSEQAHQLDMERVNLEEAAEELRLETVFDVGDATTPEWQRCVTAFEKMCTSVRIWDVTAEGGRDHYKSSASHTIDRKPVRFDVRPLASVRPDVPTLHLSNANGADLWIYPEIVAVGEAGRAPALIQYGDVRINLSNSRFIEDEHPPRDAEQVGQTWRYVNRDGGPDRRFAHNPVRPVMLYGELSFETSTGLNEVFQISSRSKAADFMGFFAEHAASLLAGRGVTT